MTNELEKINQAGTPHTQPEYDAEKYTDKKGICTVSREQYENQLRTSRSISEQDWKHTCDSIGIPSKFIKSWFHNFNADTEQKKLAKETIVKCLSEKKSMLIFGGYGTGKTHLLSAITKYSTYRFSRRSSKYFTLLGLLRAWRDSFEGMGEGKFFREVTTQDVLCLDEFNIRSNSDAENRFIQELFDTIYANEKTIVVAANATLKDFTEIVGERVIDRLKEMGAVSIVMNWKSERAAS